MRRVGFSLNNGQDPCMCLGKIPIGIKGAFTWKEDDPFTRIIPFYIKGG